MKAITYISVLCAVLLLPVCICAQGIIIPSGSYVIASNGNIVTKNNFTVNGSFTHNGGTLIFNGTTQTLSGATATTFNNITINAGSTTTVSSTGHKIKSVLLSNGTFNSNGNITLISTAAQTAAIDGTGTGQVLGTVIMQRYIASAFGYKYFSSPFQSDTVGDFSNDMTLTASFPAFYKHDESLTSNGWVAYITGSGALNVLTGYAANLGGTIASKTVDLKGVVNNGTVSRTLYNNNRIYTQGFNLVGNPYPSPINWAASSGWTKTNIDNAVYYFNAGTLNQYTGVYSSYVNGVSSDGIAGSTIAAMQGFFVHVSNGTFPVTASLGANNNVRILNSTATFYKVSGENNQSLVRMTAGFADLPDNADALTVYFDNASTPVFNKNVDALKIMNTDSLMPNLYAVSTDDQNLSIRALASVKDSIVIVPLGFSLKKDGYINFTAKDIYDIPAGWYVYFSDASTATNHDLKKEPAYKLLLAAGGYTNRFFLKFSTRDLNAPMVDPTPETDDKLKMYSSGNRLFVNPGLKTGERAQLSVITILGQIVYSSTVTGNTYTVVPQSFANGVYIINISGTSKKESRKVFIGN
ncbi:MAG: T9SS type A sorting domain-containing protein [Agriterribacter sp.]